VILLAHVVYHANRHPDVGWQIKRGREEFGRLLETRRHVAAFFAGHFHCGLRGWDDSFGVQEVVLPSASWNNDRRLATAPGYHLDEFRPGYVLAEVSGSRLQLRYRPLDGAEARRELTLRAS
jgi:hypothetical protein